MCWYLYLPWGILTPFPGFLPGRHEESLHCHQTEIKIKKIVNFFYNKLFITKSTDFEDWYHSYSTHSSLTKVCPSVTMIIVFVSTTHRFHVFLISAIIILVLSCLRATKLYLHFTVLFHFNVLYLIKTVSMFENWEWQH